MSQLRKSSNAASQPSLGFAELRLGRRRRPPTRAEHGEGGLAEVRNADEGGLAQILLGVVAMPDDPRIVYVLRSLSDPDRYYTGITGDIRSRLEWHHAGPSGCTVHHRPWAVVVAIHFADAGTARCFERYLKSGSGRAFSRRHFGPV